MEFIYIALVQKKKESPKHITMATIDTVTKTSLNKSNGKRNTNKNQSKSTHAHTHTFINILQETHAISG